MTDPQGNLPDPELLSEEQILDWIEGRLTPEEEARLSSRSGRAGLDQRVAQMKAHRRILAAAGTVAAPPELHQRVMSALERELLLTDERQATGAIPISSVVVVRSSRDARSRWRYAAPLAFAASLTLLVGGVGYWNWVTSRGGSPSLGGGQGPIALEAATDQASDAAGASLAKGEPEGVPVPAKESVPSAATHAVLAAHRPAVIDEKRAIALAQEGRLVMRVLSDDLSGLTGLEQETTRKTSRREWRLNTQVDESLAMAVRPRNIPFGLGSPQEFTHASEAALSLLGPKAMLSWPKPALIDRASRVRATYVADVPMRENTLKAVRAVFADRLDAKVVFEELAEPVETARRLDVESSLWWTQPANRWVKRVSVPIVVEAR